MPIGNRVTEKDLRTWLDRNGWYGRSAKIDHLELYAVKRPGWEQLFRFAVDVKQKPVSVSIESLDQVSGDSNSEKAVASQRLWGVVQDDERYQANEPSVWIFGEQEQMSDKLLEMSEEMIVLRSGQTSAGLPILLAIIAALIAVAALASIFLQ